MPNTDLKLTVGNAEMLLTSSGMVLDETMTYEQWHEGLALFRWAKEKIEISFAGYLEFGELHYGKERVGVSLAQLEFDLGDVTTAMRINSVPQDVRDEKLEAAHYVVLARAGIKPKEMAKWSRVAVEQNLTPTQLKCSIKHGEVVDPGATKALTYGILTIHGISQEFDVWFKRNGGEAGIGKMSQEAREEIADELEKFARLYDFIVSALPEPSAA